MADPARSLEKRAPASNLEPRESVLSADDDDVRGAGDVVGGGHALEERAGRAGDERHSGGRADRKERQPTSRVEGDEKLAGCRDGEEVRVAPAERDRWAALDPRGIEVGWVAVPRGAVDDLLAARREPRGPDGSAAEGELPERRKRGAAGEESGAGAEEGQRDRRRGECHHRHRRPAGERPRAVGCPGRRWAPAAGERGQIAEVAGQVTRCGVALLGILREAARQDSSHRPVEGFRQRRDRFGLVADDGGKRVDDRCAREGPPSRQELVEDGPEGELVGSEVDVVPFGLLRSHVGGRADGDTRSGPGGARDRRVVRGRDGRGREKREAEVEDLRVPLARDEDVGGLDVPVDESRLVRGREAPRDLRREVEGARDGERPGRDERGECPPRDELEDEEGRVGVERDVVDGDDVRVRERRGRPSFPFEVPEGAWRGARAEEELDRDVSSEPRVAGAPDLAPRAPPEQLDHLVGAEADSGVDAARLGSHAPPPSRSPSWLRSRWR